MVIGIDASRANVKERTGVEWYSYYLIEELKKLTGFPTSPIPAGRPTGLNLSLERRGTAFSSPPLSKGGTPSIPPLLRGGIGGVGTDRRDLHVILYSREPLADDLARLPPGWESRVLRWPPKKFWTQIRLSWEMLWHRPDVLFVPSHAIPIIHPKNTITTIHDIGFLRYPDLYPRHDKRYHIRALNFALTYARRIITISEITKQELIALAGAGHEKISPEKITVTHLGLDQQKYHSHHPPEAIKAILKKYNIQQPYIFFLGRLEKKKNIKNIIKAFSLLRQSKQYQLVLGGSPGFGFDTPKLRPIVHDLKDKGCLKILGFVPEADVPYLMAGASLFLFPSLYEGFGIPLLEAMASGTPIVTSRCGSMPEIVGEAAQMVENPLKPEEIASALAQTLFDEQLRRVLILRGLERAKQFSWEQCAKKTLETLLEMWYNER